MPALQNWDARPAIDMFLNDKSRRERVATEKTTKANHYKGVFDTTEKSDDEEDEKDEHYEPTTKKRNFINTFY